MAIRTKDYNDYLSAIGGLIGVPAGGPYGAPTSRISTELAEMLRISFNSAMHEVWEAYPWLDVCPNGEARFVGNRLTYPNDLSKTANWTATNLTITGDNFRNPVDGRTTASKVLETTTNGAHSVAQGSVSIVTSTGYSLSAYVRPNGRTWAYLKFNDGVNNYTAYFDVGTGATGTVSGTGATADIAPQPNGFYLCTLSFTTASTATATGTATLQVASDGSTLSYAGDTAKGLYVWGVLLQQTENRGIDDNLLAYDQTGEDRIEAVFRVWQDSPFNTSLPREVGYELTRDGIQIIAGTVSYSGSVNASGVTFPSGAPNPVFLYYRKEVPDFAGSTFSASATYAVGDQIYYTDADSVSNYWKVVVATSAGDDPDDAPTKFQKLEIPECLFWAAVWRAYGDWLISDGQADKAAGAYALSDQKVADQTDREARQMNRQLPMQVSTHGTSQWRT